MGWVICRTHPLGALRGGPGCQVCVLTWRQGLCVFGREVRTRKPPLQLGSQLVSSRLLLSHAWGVPQARTSERNCGWCGVGSLRDRSVSAPQGGEDRGQGAFRPDHTVSRAEEEDFSPLQARQGSKCLPLGPGGMVTHLQRQGLPTLPCSGGLWLCPCPAGPFLGPISGRQGVLSAGGRVWSVVTR